MRARTILFALIITAVILATVIVSQNIQPKKHTVVVPVVQTVERIKYVLYEVPRYITVTETVHWYQYKATGYSANDPEQGTTDIMASGRRVYSGALAADPHILPLGTYVEISGLEKGDGIYKVEDTGGLIKGYKIDIYFDDKCDALKINQMVWLRVIK